MIEQLKLFFEANDVIVHFVQGQVFLVLGIVMALVAYQSRQRSRLELAMALPWLAVFGLLEAVATWGDSFIPIQATILKPDVIQTLRFVQLVVYLLTFATLLGFGLRLNQPQVPSWASLTVPMVIVLIGITALVTQRVVIIGFDVIQNNSSEALIRYVLGLPAALLVAFGLRQQASKLVGSLQIPRIIRVLRVAGFGFIFYALVEGVLVPYAPFFPANLINEEMLYQMFGVPIGLLRALVGSVIVIFLFASLQAFRIEATRLEELLHGQQALMADRERISRDLHDGTIQSIFAAGLMLDDVRHSLQQPEVAEQKLQIVIQALNNTIEEVRRYIYDLRRSVTENQDLARGLLDIVVEFRLRTGMPVEWLADGCGKPALSPEQRQHIYQITREALSNVSRHARATHARVTLDYLDCTDEIAKGIRLQVSDNGRGGIAGVPTPGRGLLNMRERAALLDGTLDINSQPGKGTVVTLELSP